ncbi:CbtA family protein [Streptomyces cupreus]|uniref:CbtA family protein n=1 Tax=Streptomyces cupreus TaxID=2759956 RepID=A0A7X1J8L7_9ACTN|nr:CbtA family protein [Streptomyces cupreus]MBC2906195.1 CbtA family protein [Streptomyces cupreus]
MNSATVRTLLVRGMLTGIATGLLVFGFAYLVGESPLRSALVFEAAHATEHGPELVSRTLQETAGLATGVLFFTTAFAGIAALAFCFALGRIGRFGPRVTAGLVALGGFVTVFLVPFLKYPANPPAVSAPDTLNQRTALYWLMIALSVLIGIAAVVLGQRLAPRLGNWNATIAASVAFVVAVGLALAFLPAVNEMPEGFPANVVWDFRVAAAGMQLLLWASFGVIFGHLAERVLEPRTTTAPTQQAAPPQAAPAPH